MNDVQRLVDLLDALHIPTTMDVFDVAHLLAVGGHRHTLEDVRVAVAGRICRQLARQDVEVAS